MSEAFGRLLGSLLAALIESALLGWAFNAAVAGYAGLPQLTFLQACGVFAVLRLGAATERFGLVYTKEGR